MARSRLARARPALLPGLTGLRGLGAAWVFLFHLTYVAAPPVLREGYLGVDVFFILSGFVLSHAHTPRAAAGWSWSGYHRFLQFRLARIYPLHLVALLLVALVVLAWPGFSSSFGPDPARFSLRSFLASLLLVQNLGIGLPTGWNTPSWSLSAEWFASLLFPGFLFVACRFRTAAGATVATVAALLGFVMFLAAIGKPTPDVAGLPGMIRMGCEFLAGCTLYRVYAAGGRAGTLLGGIALALFAAGMLLPGGAVLALFSFPVAVLLAAADGNPLSRALGSRPLQFLGDISYSLYLLHWIGVQVAVRLAERWDLPDALLLPWYAGLVALTIAVSALSHRFIELPARDRWRALAVGWRTPVRA